MKRMLLSVWMGVTVLLCPIALGGHGSGTGGGDVEGLFVYVHDYLGVFIEETLSQAEAAKLTQAEIATLKTVAATLKTEPSAAKNLSFEQKPANLAAYQACQAGNLAHTLHQPAATIFVDSSRFYKEGKQAGTLEATIGLELVVASVFHQLGHHAKIADHKGLQDLGEKVAGIAAKHVECESNRLQALMKAKRERAQLPLLAADAIGKTVSATVSSGFVLPHSLNATEPSIAYFLPNRSRSLFRLAPVKAEKQTGLPQPAPFSGQLEILATGKLFMEKGTLSLQQNASGDTVAVGKIWATENNFSGMMAVQGQFHLNPDGKLYVVIETENQPVSRWADFLLPAFREGLEGKIKKEGPLSGTLFLAEPFKPNDGALRVTVATVLAK